MLSNRLPMMVLQLDNSKWWNMAPEDILSIDKYLDPAQVTSDERLATLMAIMCDEVKEGCPSGKLFGEAISLALLAYLAARYAPVGQTNNCETSLSPAQKSVVVDYIRSNLSNNIAVTDLARSVQMSPSHFTRLFRAAFGVTPYRFVMHERIEGAKAMLASTQLSASDVASAYGFASQSHFTKVFRQFAGVTPKQYKFRV
jgi:AraC family transcriptional regulator